VAVPVESAPKAVAQKGGKEAESAEEEAPKADQVPEETSAAAGDVEDAGEKICCLWQFQSWKGQPAAHHCVKTYHALRKPHCILCMPF